MHIVKTNPVKSLSFLFIAAGVLLACWGLFYLDHETHSVRDLFKPGNIVALLIYFIPAYLICMKMHHFFIKKYDEIRSISLSLLAGLPLGFTVIILFMILLRTWKHY